MNLKSFFLFCFFFYGATHFMEVQAQTIPLNNPSKGKGLHGLPSQPQSGMGLESIVSKPQIPYLEELKQIQSVKQSFDSIKSELKTIKEQASDSTQQDSLVQVAKSWSREVLDKESQVLESLIQKEEIPGEELRNAAERTLSGVQSSKEKLAGIQDFESLEGLLDQSEENLKALTNEWLMPKIEQAMTGTLASTWDPTQAKIPDFYGRGALEKLLQDGADPKELMGQAKEQAVRKAKHISNEYIQEAQGKFSKLKLDSLGNVRVVLDEEKRKFKLLEPNTLKGSGLLGRTGLLLWYDPLTSFREGFFAEAGVSYGFTHQLQGFGAWTVNRNLNDATGPHREGQGPKVGLRFSKGNWGFQSAISYNQINIVYPSGFESRNFSGKQWSGELSLVRTIPMGKILNSVVMVSWDPLYKEDRSLAGSAIKMKIGFELGRLKGLRKEFKPELDKKIPEGRIKEIEPDIPISHRVEKPKVPNHP
jgi:hypothetical protein